MRGNLINKTLHLYTPTLRRCLLLTSSMVYRFLDAIKRVTAVDYLLYHWVTFPLDPSNYSLVSAKAILLFLLVGSVFGTTFDTRTPSRGDFPLETFLTIAEAQATNTKNRYNIPPNITITNNEAAFMPSSNTIFMISIVGFSFSPLY